MDSKLFIFIAASISSLCWTNLANPYLTLLVILLALVSSFFVKTRLLAFGLLGVCWMASLGHWQYSLQLPLTQISEPVLLEGEVLSLVHAESDVRFNFSVTSINRQPLWPARKVRLSWERPDWPVKQDQRWQLMAKLKPPHGLANQGSFNYQQWLFSENISATGYVRTSSTNQLLQNNISLRQQLADRLLSLPLQHTAWLAALSLGYRGLLEQSDWQLVQTTGIAHLIAISGLHLALVASLSYLLVVMSFGTLLSRFSGLQQINLHKLALLASLAACLGYAGLAGFALPTVRAWLMLALVTVLYLGNRNISLKRLILISVGIFILLFPLSLFSLSFWLSFSAVGIIVLVFWRWPPRRREFSWRQSTLVMLRIQLALSVLMLPLVAWQFGLISWISPWVNMLAVPLVTMLLVPLCLLAVLCLVVWPPLAQWLFEWLDKALSYGLQALQFSTQLPAASWRISSIPLEAWLCLSLASLALLLPHFPYAKRAALVLLLPLLSYARTPDDDDWYVDVLDVGQGSAVLISRAQRALIYDVGAAYPSGFNMADSVILPLLQARGIRQVDKVIISHWDNDHSGSLLQLQKGIPVRQVVTTADWCVRGQQAMWQGLTLQVLWPDDPALHNDNNGSCVLYVSDGLHSVLLPGDIDASIEQRLAAAWPFNAQLDILLAPHHGSNSSSSTTFIQVIQPQHVVFSQGYMNRWQFPRTEVLQRYAQAGSQTYATSELGQLSFRVPFQQAQPITLRSYRQDFYPYWYANFPQSDK